MKAKNHIRGFRSASPFMLFLLLALFIFTAAHTQVVSPVQGGHYVPVVKNVRDMATPPSGLFVLWYNAWASSNKYIDRNGNKFDRIDIGNLNPSLPSIEVSTDLNAFTSIPTIFWASNFEILGARYMAGVSANYINADVSVITERNGAILDTTFTRRAKGNVSGISDLFVAPVGLSWGLENSDITFLYGFYAPTGKYETGGDDNVGLGFWTHQFQGYGYYYPVQDRSSAIMLGLTYETNSKIDDADVRPGDRFSLEYGVSQYLSERLELTIQGGHNWQIGDDKGDDVYWDPSFHDRKSSLGFGLNYWIWKDHLQMNFKYAFDYGIRQRYKNNLYFVNLVFVPDILTGKQVQP